MSMPVGGGEELRELADCFTTGWWGKGPKVEQFERDFAAMVGAKYAIAVSSATAGQDLIYKALGFDSDSVISPTISFLTTGVVPLWNRCNSLLVDVQAEDLTICPDDVARRVTPNVRAIVAVNFAGVLADIERLRAVFDGLIIEDCAHSCYTPGSGARGDAAVWSFQAVKTLATGDGGMITTNSQELYEKIIPLTWLGISSTYSRTKPRAEGSPEGRPGYSWDYEVDTIGYKAYMTDLTAAVGLAQMRKLDSSLAHRRAIARRYDEQLHQTVRRPPFSHTVQYYVARIPGGLRDELIDYLADKRIHTSVHYKPLHNYPILRQDWSFPVADSLWKDIISLPCHAGMSLEDADYVCYWINNFLAGATGRNHD